MESPRLNILHVVLLIAVILGVAFPFFATGRPISYKDVCRSNLRQLSTATLMYQSDFDERFPPETWSEATKPYAKSYNIYTCPDIAKKKGQWGYAIDYAIVGKGTGKFADTANSPLYFEIDALAPNVVANIDARSTKRHIMGSNVTFLDGSTKFIRAETKLADLAMTSRK